MDRQNELRLPAETPWLNDPKVARVCTAIEDGGYDIFFVGGCVRNVVLDEVASDIDMSTNARPETVMKLAKDAGLKAIPTGIDHGTVTVVSSGTPYEITTFRRDVETDGRRAVVAFSDDIIDDARRRDFTMNALYARPDGSIVDPLGGIQDVLDRRVRFIEDADQRIREDYLRTLRFFRFSAWYGAIDQGFDLDALNAISSNLDGLETLSAERVGMEMVKLLNAPDPAVAVAVMRQTGVLNVVLQGADDTWLAPLIHVESLLDLSPDPMRRLAALGGTGVEIDPAPVLSRRRVFWCNIVTALDRWQVRVSWAYRLGCRCREGHCCVALRIFGIPACKRDAGSCCGWFCCKIPD